MPFFYLRFYLGFELALKIPIPSIDWFEIYIIIL